jgi:hypothetical protein
MYARGSHQTITSAFSGLQNNLPKLAVYEETLAGSVSPFFMMNHNGKADPVSRPESGSLLRL